MGARSRRAASACRRHIHEIRLHVPNRSTEQVSPVRDAELRAWLCGHDLPEAPVKVTALALMAQQHDGRFITWDVLDVFALGRAGPR